MTRTLLLIDGHSQFYRAIYAPGPPLTSPDGEPTKGTYIFTQMLLSVLRERAPTHVAVAVDGPRTKLERRRIDPTYKAKRHGGGDVPEEILVQVSRMKEIVKALGLPIFRARAWEADDVLATLVSRFHHEVDFTEVVTRDRDLHQLVSDKRNVACFDPQDGKLTRAEDVHKHWGVYPKRVVEMKILMGDPGDGVKGAPGIGPKRALDLIRQYGTAENVKANASRLPPAIRSCMDSYDVARGRMLVGLNREVALEPEVRSIKQLRFNGPDLASARPLFSQLGFRQVG